MFSLPVITPALPTSPASISTSSASPGGFGWVQVPGGFQACLAQAWGWLGLGLGGSRQGLGQKQRSQKPETKKTKKENLCTKREQYLETVAPPRGKDGSVSPLSLRCHRRPRLMHIKTAAAE